MFAFKFLEKYNSYSVPIVFQWSTVSFLKIIEINKINQSCSVSMIYCFISENNWNQQDQSKLYVVEHAQIITTLKYYSTL
jgi:hypothetical protein